MIQNDNAWQIRNPIGNTHGSLLDRTALFQSHVVMTHQKFHRSSKKTKTMTRHSHTLWVYVHVYGYSFPGVITFLENVKLCSSCGASQEKFFHTI